VQGTLKAEGTSLSPIIFTTVNDNSIGGTTGTGTPAAGQWDAIRFESASINSTIRNAVVKYGGYTGYYGPQIPNGYGYAYPASDGDTAAIIINSSSVLIANSEINGNKTGIMVGSGTAPTISACNILNNSENGISAVGASPVIQSSILKQNGNGISATSGSTPTIEGCTFDSNVSFGVYADATSSNAHINNSTYVGTKPFNQIIGGTLTTDTTWSNDASF
jgi:parallel beta-helix repeat protein